MDDINTYPLWVRIGIEQLSALLQVALERGITPGFTLADVFAAMDLSQGEVFCLVQISHFHELIHEMLYALPQK